MRIGIMGTGGVGRTLAGALSEREHEVVMGSRDPEAALASTDVNQQTDTTLSGWHESNTAVRVATFAEAAAHGEVLMLATAGNGSLAATAAAGDDHPRRQGADRHLEPVVVVGPGAVADRDEHRLARRAGAAAASAARRREGAEHRDGVPHGRSVDARRRRPHAPICGNDDDAKQQVTRWLGEWFGWRDVLDLGDLSGARATEAYLLFWIRLYQATGSPIVNTKVVR